MSERVIRSAAAIVEYLESLNPRMAREVADYIYGRFGSKSPAAAALDSKKSSRGGMQTKPTRPFSSESAPHKRAL